MQSYRIRLAISGTPAIVFQASVPDIREELAYREYLERPHVVWDADMLCIIIEVEHPLPNDTFESAEQMLNDDLSDTVSACIADWEEWDFQVLDVSPV